jgi:sulfide:quinone oxidoreductase
VQGAGAIGYDALLIAVGARAQPHFPHVLTIDDRRIDEQLHGLVQDVEEGYTRSIAFLTPPRMAWPLPLYELALMTSRRAYAMNVDVEITVTTPEDAPLEIFGAGVSQAVAALLEDAGIRVLPNAYVDVPRPGEIVVHPGDVRLAADRVVALPELVGPSIRGLPEAEHGFLPVGPDGAVRGVERVYAAGDATDFAVKHGGIAAQQADAAAASIAALAGADVEPEPFHPTIHGILLTGAEPLYLEARITGGAGFSSQATETPGWPHPAKIAARRLAPYLDALEPEAAP